MKREEGKSVRQKQGKKKRGQKGEKSIREKGKMEKNVALRASKRRDGTEEVEAATDRAIVELAGAALPKVNWSTPKEAAWIAADTPLRCASFAHAALHLRPSQSPAQVEEKKGCEEREGEEVGSPKGRKKKEKKV